MSKMGVNTVLRPAPRIGPGSALITPRRPGSTPDSSLHVRTPKPASSIRQRLQPSQDVFRSSQAPGETPARLPPGVRPRRCHCSLTSRSGPAPRPPLSLPPPPPSASSSWRPRPWSLPSPDSTGLPPWPGRGCAPLRSPQLAFVIPAPFLASPPTPRRTAKRGERSYRHTWNPQRARSLRLPIFCGEGSACGRASVCPCPTCAVRALIMIWSVGAANHEWWA